MYIHSAYHLESKDKLRIKLRLNLLKAMNYLVSDSSFQRLI